MTDAGDEKKQEADATSSIEGPQAEEGSSDDTASVDDDPPPVPEPTNERKRQHGSAPDVPVKPASGETPRWVLVVGSIAVPLVAAVAAFGGAVWGANSQTTDNRETIKAERDRLYDQFRLAQKQEQYAAIRQQATRLENAGDFSTTGLAAGFAGLGLQQALGTSEGAGLDAGDLRSTENPYGSALPFGTGGASVLDHTRFPGRSYGELYASAKYGLDGAVASSWQDAYTGLDQAISNAEIASSDEVIDIARALRDKYRSDYYESVLKTIDEKILPGFPPDKPKPDRLRLADAMVGVPAESSQTYPNDFATKSTEELTQMYVEEVQKDLQPPP